MDDLFLYTRYSSTKELQLRTGTGVIVFKPPNPKEKKKEGILGAAAAHHRYEDILPQLLDERCHRPVDRVGNHS